MTVKERFDNLLSKKEKAKAAIIQLETKRDSAEESMAEIEKEWKDTYGLETREAVEKEIEDLESSVNMLLDECEKYLEKAGV